jgi:hypothetical protein
MEIFEDAAGDFAASLTNDFFVIGAPNDVRRYRETIGAAPVLSAEKFKQMSFFGSTSSAVNIITYTNDESRVRNFFAAISTAKGARAPASAGIDEAIAKLPYSVTETTLGERGLERTTRSPLGQFSTLLPLLIPEQSALIKEGNQSR